MNHKFNYFLLVIHLTFCTLSFSQKDPFKFGKISDEEMKMTIYDKDTSAPAIILAQYANMRIEYREGTGFILNIDVLKRIKILTKDGLEYANDEVLLYTPKIGDDEELVSFKGQTYNLENDKPIISKITRKEVFSEQKSENSVLKKFALPNVKVGSVIEYEYEVSSPYFWSIDPWYFQDDIPTVWSELRLYIPEYFNFKNVFGGYVSPTTSETSSTTAMLPGGTKSYIVNSKQWIYKDIPAFKTEDFITTEKDYLAKVDFELESTISEMGVFRSYTTSWDKIGQDLMESDNFGGALDRHGMVKELIDKINPKDSLNIKVESAYKLIKENLKWDETFGIYIGDNLKSVSTKKEGSMAEINLLLVNLLRSVGVEANPVLISTRSHGRINKFYPRQNNFNTVVAAAIINGKKILLDATIPFLRPGQLSFNSLNGEGLMVSKDKIEWIPLLSSEQYSSTSMVTLEIKDGQLAAKMTRASKSMEAMDKRQEIASEGKDKFIENYKKKNSNWEIASYSIENDNSLNDPLKEEIIINNFNNIEVNDDIIYLPSVLVDEVQKNPFSSETREYPVDFGVPRFERYILLIKIPDGYDVDELPKGTTVSLPDNAASFSYQIQKLENNVQVSCTLKINKTIYLPTEYEYLKELFKNIIAKYGEQIVLKKKV